MRFLVKATIPLEAGNDLVRDPEMGARIQQLMEDLKPEAAYFGAVEGQRAMFLVLNMNEASEIMMITEPLWLGFEADIEMWPVMTPDDLTKGAAKMEDLLEKY